MLYFGYSGRAKRYGGEKEGGRNKKKKRGRKVKGKAWGERKEEGG